MLNETNPYIKTHPAANVAFVSIAVVCFQRFFFGSSSTNIFLKFPSILLSSSQVVFVVVRRFVKNEGKNDLLLLVHHQAMHCWWEIMISSCRTICHERLFIFCICFSLLTSFACTSSLRQLFHRLTSRSFTCSWPKFMWIYKGSCIVVFRLLWTIVPQ